MQNVKVLHFHTSLASVLPCRVRLWQLVLYSVLLVHIMYRTEHQEIRNTIDYYTRCFCAQFLSNRLHVSKWKILVVIPIVMLHTAGGDFFTFPVYSLRFCNQNQRVSKGEKLKNLKKSASGGATGPGFFLVSDLPPACLAMSAEHKLLYVRPYLEIVKCRSIRKWLRIYTKMCAEKYSVYGKLYQTSLISIDQHPVAESYA